MHGDYTRSAYRPEQRYSSVRMQQGRVWLDGDWNEQVELDDHRRRTLVGDVVGCCGAPAGEAGFAVRVAPVLGGGPPDLLFSSGRVWARGMLCALLAEPKVAVTATAATVLRAGAPVVAGRSLEKDQWVEVGPDAPDDAEPPVIARIATVTVTDEHVEVTLDRAHPLGADEVGRMRRLISYRTQPDLPASALVEPNTGTRYVAYLEVWERHLTTLEEPDLREVALGGPDTTTRTRVVGQVKLHALSADATVPRCLQLGPCWSPPAEGPVGRLAARAEPDTAAPTPCAVPEEAGFRGLGNQSYLVQVRGSGTSFVFSRDHGSVTHAVAAVGTDGRVVLVTPPLDRYRTPRANDWMELVDDESTLSGTPGSLVQVDDLGDDGASFTTVPPLPVLSADDARRRHTFLRRWDQRDGVRTSGADAGTLALTPGDDWLPLEEGVQVRFAAGRLRDGDFWTIPARTAIGDEGGDVLWPRDGTEPRFEEPHGPRRGYCALAVLVPDEAGSWTVERCLPEFVPVAAQVTFDVVGGDGQQGAPGDDLPLDLQVRVARGGLPLVGAQVVFTAEAGGGTVVTPQPVETTGTDGVAAATVRLGAAGAHRFRATLLAGDATTPVPGAVAVFGATAVPPATGGDCERTVGPNGEFATVQDALGALHGTRQVCLCLEGADHDLTSLTTISSLDHEIRTLTLSGCGPVTRLILGEPLTVLGFQRLVLADLAVVAQAPVGQERSALTVQHCQQLHLTRCWLSASVEGPTPGKVASGATLAIERVPQVRVRDCTVEAFHPNFADDRGTRPARILDGVDPTLVGPLFLAQNDDPFRFTGPMFADAAADVARQLAPDQATRDALAQNLTSTLDNVGGDQLTPLEHTALRNLVQLLVSGAVTDPEAFVVAFEAIRRAAIRSDGAVAFVLDQDSEDRPFFFAPGPTGGEHVVVEGCEVLGTFSLCGPTTGDTLNSDQMGSQEGNAQQGNVQGRAGSVRLQGNTLDQLTIGLALWQRLANFTQEPFQAVPSSLLVVQNIVTTRRHILVAGRLSVSGNMFTVGAERVDDQLANTLLGWSLTDSATFLGNHGTLAFGKPLDWISAARAEDSPHNLDLDVN